MSSKLSGGGGGGGGGYMNVMEKCNKTRNVARAQPWPGERKINRPCYLCDRVQNDVKSSQKFLWYWIISMTKFHNELTRI